MKTAALIIATLAVVILWFWSRDVALDRNIKLVVLAPITLLREPPQNYPETNTEVGHILPGEAVTALRMGYGKDFRAWRIRGVKSQEGWFIEDEKNVQIIDTEKLARNVTLPASAEKFSLGDNVRIHSAPATQAAGAAGRVGNVAGFTKPSYSRVEVIGEVKDDLAFSVIFENPHAQLWFAPELLEFVDHAPGLDIQIGKKRLVRRADGGWDEVPK